MITLEEAMAFGPEDTRVGDSGYRLIDGDTVRNDEGHSIRLDGINTPEIQHSRDVYEGDKIPDQAGHTSFVELSKLAKKKGFTQVVDHGTKDTYDRSLGDLMNPETGELWTMYLARNNLADINKYSSQEHQMAYLRGISERTSGVADLDAEEVAAKMRDGSYDPEAEALSLKLAEANIGDNNPRDAFKFNALNEREYARDPDAYSGVAIRSLDRNLMNEAHNQWSTSLDTSLISMTESYHGFRQLLGDIFEMENLELSGKLGAEAARYRMRLNPYTTVSLDQIEGVGDFIDYLGNNAAMSVPYMATTMASAVAGGAVGGLIGGPVGGVVGIGAGLFAPSAIYSGQVYNEQDEKNAGWALTSGVMQAVVDRVGLKGIKMSVTGLNNSKKGLNEIMEALIKKGASKEAATAIVTKATRRELAEYMDDAAGFAKNQVKLRNSSRSVLNAAGKAFGAEAVTESTQELFGFMGANWDKEHLGIYEEGKFSKDLQDRLLNAAVAGGLLGGGMGAGGGVVNVGKWADVAHKTSTDGRNKPVEFDWQEQAEGGDNQEYNSSLVAPRDSDGKVKKGATENVALRIVNADELKKARTKSQVAFQTVFNAPGRFFQKMMISRLDKPSLAISETMRRLASYSQGTLNRVHGGRDIEGDQNFKATRARQLIGNMDKVINGYRGIRNDRKAAQTFNKDFSRVSKDYIAHGDANFKNKTDIPFDWSKYSSEEVAVFLPLFKRMELSADFMRKDQNEAWMSGGYADTEKFKHISNYLLRYKEMDKMAVEANESKFMAKLVEHFDYSKADARELMNKMINGDMDQSVDQDDVFNLMTRGLNPGSSKERSIGLSQHPEFAEFFHQDVAHNIQAATSSAARFSTYHNFIGKDNWKLDVMYNRMIDEGVSPAVVNQTAADFEVYIAAMSGNYKRPKKGTPGYRALAVQQNTLLYSVFTSLPMSAMSSLVELATVTNGLNHKQIYGKGGALQNIGLEFSKGLYESMMRVVDESWSGHKRINNGELNALVERAGLGLEAETGAATTTGASELSSWKKEWTDRFFRYNGLSELTNRQRSARAGSANDFMMNHMDIIIQGRGKPDTNEVIASKVALRNIGMDINRISTLIDPATKDIDYDTLSPNEKKFWDDQRDSGMYNFINDAIALPGSANRPLFYQDPRLAMFTQFNGFIAVFTAHHIPKMWNEYIKNGSPSMRYNTFAMMTTMIMLGFVSQYLKDLIKYGETSPYLTDAGKMRRAVNSSGLLGTGERLINLMFPMYDKNTTGIVDNIGTTVLDEMPAMAPVVRMVEAAGHLNDGNGSKAVYSAMRAAPLTGPLTGLAKYVSGNDF
jgi:hypothetical protein